MKKRTVIRADEMGFCLGVRRAVGILEEAVSREDSQVYTLGPIIHNPQVIADFASKKVIIAHSPGDLPPGSRVVIRAHGIPPQTLAALHEKNCRIMDGTCPKVIASQKTVKKYARLGYHTVIVGDKDHGEIQGLAGYSEHPIVISSPGEAASLVLKGPVMAIGQTTIKQEEYDRVCRVLEKQCPEVKIVSSICSATSKRQEALISLCSRVDACLIIGGKESANTHRLYLSACETGIPCWHIQSYLDIPEELYHHRIIGISAGASTPDSIIQEVEDHLLGD